jgi:hypothetical protein
MIAFVMVCVGFSVVAGIWLYQKAQGRERPKADKKLTDALESLKRQGKNASLETRKKDEQNGK